MTLRIHVCDECGKRRDSDANHWFIVYGQAAQARFLTIRDWAEVSEPGPHIEVCGPGCALKLVSKWMGGTLDPRLVHLLAQPRPQSELTEEATAGAPAQRRSIVGFRELSLKPTHPNSPEALKSDTLEVEVALATAPTASQPSRKHEGACAKS